MRGSMPSLTHIPTRRALGQIYPQRSLLGLVLALLVYLVNDTVTITE
jgi:hypothetical protein